MQSSIKLNLFDKFMIMVCEYPFQDDEVIKEITKYNSNGRYYISNYGNVITLCFGRWMIKKPEKDKDGYLVVGLWYHGHRVKKAIHQLVAEAFVVNPAPKEKTLIHHIDFNPLNNKAFNLVYVSPSEHRKIHEQHKKEANKPEEKENFNGLYY